MTVFMFEGLPLILPRKGRRKMEYLVLGLKSDRVWLLARSRNIDVVTKFTFNDWYYYIVHVVNKLCIVSNAET